LYSLTACEHVLDGDMTEPETWDKNIHSKHLISLCPREAQIYALPLPQSEKYGLAVMANETKIRYRIKLIS